MIKGLRLAQQMMAQDRSGLPRLDVAPPTPYLRRMVRLSLLAPDIQDAILSGRQPVDLTLERLSRAEIPASWARQRQLFGF